MFDNTQHSNIINVQTILNKSGDSMSNQALQDVCKITQIDLTNKIIENLKNFSDLNKSSQTVLTRLTRYFNAQKEAKGEVSIYPSCETLADNTNLSVRTVKRAIKELKEAGYIFIIKSGRFNKYKLTNKLFERVYMSPEKRQNVTSIGDTVAHKQRSLTNKFNKKIYIKKFKNSIRFKELSKPAISDIEQPKILKDSSFSDSISSIYNDNIYYVKTNDKKLPGQNIPEQNFKFNTGAINNITEGYKKDIRSESKKIEKDFSEKWTFAEKKNFIWEKLSASEQQNYFKLSTDKNDFNNRLNFVIRKFENIKSGITEEQKKEEIKKAHSEMIKNEDKRTFAEIQRETYENLEDKNSLFAQSLLRRLKLGGS